MLLVACLILVGCNSKTSKIKNALLNVDSNIKSVKSIDYLQVHFDTVRTETGKTYKFKASVEYRDGSEDDIEKFIFIANKDGWTKLGESSNIE